MSTRRLILTALLSSAGLLSLTPATAHAQQKKSRDLITREEIESSPQKDQDIYAVIRSLRPHFLAPARGVRTLGNSTSRMSLYVDGVRETDAAALKNIMASTVACCKRPTRWPWRGCRNTPSFALILGVGWSAPRRTSAR